MIGFNDTSSVSDALSGQTNMPPEQKRKMALAQMLIGGAAGAAGTPMGALGMLGAGLARGWAANPKNSDQGFGSWAPTVTR